MPPARDLTTSVEVEPHLSAAEHVATSVPLRVDGASSATGFTTQGLMGQVSELKRARELDLITPAEYEQARASLLEAFPAQSDASTRHPPPPPTLQLQDETAGWGAPPSYSDLISSSFV